MIRYIIFLGLSLFLLVSCSQDEELSYNTDNTTDVASVTFNLSMDQALLTDTDYTPMKSFEGYDNGTKVIITNAYRAYIIKEVGSKWIIDKILDIQIDTDDTYNLKTHKVKDNTKFHSFSTDLRPGNYRMTVITGYKSLSWNGTLKEGTIVSDSEDSSIKTPWACTYKPVGSGGYLFEGQRSLPEEIFTNTIPFVIEKTEDLHSIAKPATFPVSLHRMVTKLRVLLKCEDEPSSVNFYPDEPNAITANLETREGKTFCAGLDIWGQPYYENPLYGYAGQGEYITNLKFIVNCWQTPHAPILASNGSSYIMGMSEGSRQYAPFYFSDPNNEEIPITMSQVEVTGSSSFYLKFVYAYPEADAYEDGIDMVLKHNNIYGVVFKPSEVDWKDPRDIYGSYDCQGMILETDANGVPVDARTIFDDFFEYRVKIQP